MSNSLTFDMITVSGEPYERGYQYGQQLREKITARIRGRLEDGQSMGLDKDRVMADVMKFWPFIQEYSKDLAREIQGIADGSGSKLDDIVMLNSDPLWTYSSRSAATMGCTSFAVGGDATRDGATYVGQNDDLWPSFSEFATIIRIESDTTTCLGLAFSGEFPRIGLNSHGIAVCVNGLYDGVGKPGVGQTVISREILQQETIGDALNAIMRADRGHAANTMLGDKNGELYDVEMTTQGYEVMYGEDMLAHANHFLARWLAETDRGRERPGSLHRYNRLNKLLHKSLGRIDPEILQQFLADHVNYPRSICCHPSAEMPLSRRFKTVASLIMRPEDGLMLLAEGNPCEKPFLELQL